METIPMAAGTDTSSELNVFLTHRRLLFSIAYRMMGSVSDAEDIVQEAYLRWCKANESPAKIRDHRSLLVSITTRLCIDEWKTARRKREMYVGPYLPEPVPTAMVQSREDAYSDQVDQAFLLLLEQLKPVERGVFVLREAFGYSYAEIAKIVRKSEAACRQILRRARVTIDVNQRPGAIDRTQELLLQRYVRALVTADPELLLSVIAEDAQLHSDGGGIVGAAQRTVYGRVAIAALLLGVRRKGGPAEVYTANVNGMPALVAYRNGKPILVHCLDMDEGIRAVYGILNPRKLSAFRNRDELIRKGILHPVRIGITMRLRWLWNHWMRPRSVSALRQMVGHMR